MGIERFKTVPWWLTLIGAAIGGLIMYFVNPYFVHTLEAGRNREVQIEEVRTENYRAISTLVGEFNVAVEAFTFELNKKMRLNSKMQTGISVNLTKQYDAVSKSKLSAPTVAHAALDDYLVAILNLRDSLLSVRDTTDTNSLYTKLSDYYEKQKLALSLIAPKSG